MSGKRHFSDEDLTAFLDGEADAALAREIAAAESRDPNVRDRLQALHLSRDVVREALDTVLADAPDVPVLPQVAAPMDWRAAVIGGLAACLVLGAIGLSQWPQDRAPGWRDYVAAYQALYVTDTLASVPAARDPDARLKELGATLGRDLSFAADAPRLNFKRGQVLGFEGRTLIQLAYLSPDGAPMALCIIRDQDAGDTGITSETLEGMSAAHWSRDGFAYLLIGSRDDDLVRQAARAFMDAL